MISVKSSITSLEKSAKLLSEWLEERDYNVTFDVYKSGRISDCPSYITIQAIANDHYIYVSVKANDYGNPISWKEVKQKVKDSVEYQKDLELI